jgi:hypothetical protein
MSICEVFGESYELKLLHSLIGVPCSEIEKNTEQGLTNVDLRSIW